jgi:hypothetical protein
MKLTVVYDWEKDTDFDPEHDGIASRYYLIAQTCGDCDYRKIKAIFPQALVEKIAEDVPGRAYRCRVWDADRDITDHEATWESAFDTEEDGKKYCEYIMFGSEPPEEIKLELVEEKLER